MDTTLSTSKQLTSFKYNDDNNGCTADSSRFTTEAKTLKIGNNTQEITTREVICPSISHIIKQENNITSYFLLESIKTGRVSCVKLALEQPQHQINEPIYGKTLLQHAIENEQLNIVKYLIEKGANLNIEPNPMLLCCEQLEYDFYPYIVYPRKTEKLKRTLDIMKYLLQQGISPNYYKKSFSGITTPLIECISRNSIEAFKLLLSYNADFNFPEKDFTIAESLARNDIQFLNIALANGLKKETIYQNGLQIIHTMCLNNALKHIELLLSYNIDVNAKAHPNGATPLHYILSSSENFNKIKIAELLIKHGADLHSKGYILSKNCNNYSFIEKINKQFKSYRPIDLLTNETEKNKLEELYLKYNSEKSDNQQPEETVINQPKANSNGAKFHQNNIQDSDYDDDCKKTKQPSFFKRVKKLFSCSSLSTNSIVNTQEVTATETKIVGERLYIDQPD